MVLEGGPTAQMRRAANDNTDFEGTFNERVVQKVGEIMKGIMEQKSLKLRDSKINSLNELDKTGRLGDSQKYERSLLEQQQKNDWDSIWKPEADRMGIPYPITD